MKAILPLLFSGLFCLFTFSSKAQCCAAGNPTSGGSGGGIGKQKLSIAVNHRYSFSDTYYNGNEKTDYFYLQESDFHFTSLNLKYGITDKLTSTLELGYFESKTKTFNDIKSKAYGLGDAVFGLQYAFKISEGLSIQPNINVTFPIGKFDFISNGVLFPIDFQPSAGSYRAGGGFSSSYIFKNARWRSSLFASINYSAPVQSERVSYYKYGNLYLGGISTSYRIWRKLNVSLLARYQYREKATMANDFIMNSTGGHVAFLSPKVSYGFGNMWNANIGVDLPIYKNMNGRQLTNAYMIAGGISKTIDFNQTLDSADIELALSQKHQVTTIEISGTCKACQMAIENLANKQKGVITASWSVKTHVLEIHHNEKFNLDKLLAKLNKLGHIKESEPTTNPVHKI